MGRPRLHDYPPDEMLRNIAAVIRGNREALEAILAEAQAEQAAEREAYAKSNAAREAAGLPWHEWAKLHPDPPRGDGWHREVIAKRALADLASEGVPYDLPEFTGQTLTPSARIAAQTCIRKLESAGLVELFGTKARSVRLLPAGLAALEATANV